MDEGDGAFLKQRGVFTHTPYIIYAVVGSRYWIEFNVRDAFGSVVK